MGAYMLDRCIITYIFGDKNEILRDPVVYSQDIQYICVTDQPNLQSEIWDIVVDVMPSILNPRDKISYVKYNPFKYTSASHVCVIDGSMQIIGQMETLFSSFQHCDLLVKRHPEAVNLLSELNRWITIRSMPAAILNIFKTMALHDHIDLSADFLIESCILGYARTDNILQLCQMVIKYMEFIGNAAGIQMCPTNQCVLTYLIEKTHTKFQYIDQGTYVTRYQHGSWILNNH